MENKIKMIVADMDGTVVDYASLPFHSSWDALYTALGLQEENMRLLEEYYSKKELELEWTNKQVGLLKGHSVKKAINGIFPIPYSRGAREFFASLDRNYVKGILTTGINLIADVVKEELNLDFALSNILHHDNSMFKGTYEARVWLWKKVEKLKEIALQFNVPLDSICFIGDNDNDIDCFKIVGLPVAFNPKTEETRKSAKYVISDFTELKGILKNFE